MTEGVLLALRLLLTALLYGFLGIALYVLWRGLHQNEQAAVCAPAPAKVVVEQGDDVGRVIPLQPITAIGRAENNPIVVDDPFASANHAIIIWREDRWWLEDLDSHNGTYLNEARVTQPATLASGDRIRIGQTVLRFERATLDESSRSATQ